MIGLVCVLERNFPKTVRKILTEVGFSQTSSDSVLQFILIRLWIQEFLIGLLHKTQDNKEVK